MTQQPKTLREVIKDCGGVSAVARRFQRSNQSVDEWMQRGHLPFSDLKGKTTYSEELAEMQQEGSLTAAEIRRIGFRL